MKKIGISDDPKQQALRDLKKEWQNQMKVFIAQSIALKRGIAGRGDAKAGLPPSSIKDPLPNEISTYIEEMSIRFNNLVNIANQIVNNQLDYSKTRRKSRKELELLQANIINDLFEKKASNPLSRTWAIWTQSPWFSDDQATKSRLRILSSLADLQDQINDIEFILAGQDKKALTHAFFAYLRFVGLLRNRIIDKVNKEVERQRTEFTGVPQSEFDKLDVKPVKIINPSEAFIEAQNKIEENKQTSEKEEDLTKNVDIVPPSDGKVDTSSERVALAKAIKLDLQNIKPIIAQYNSLIESGSLTGSIINIQHIDKYQLAATELTRIALAIASGSDVNFSAFESAYKELVSNMSEKMNQKANTLSELFNNLTKSSSKNEAITKLAKKRFDRWVRRLTLSLYNDEFSKSKLDTVKKLRDLSNLMDIILNLLEKRDTKIAELFYILSELYKSVAVISYDFVQFANHHNAYYGQQTASGDKHDIGPINRVDISSLNKEINLLVQDVKEMQGKSISSDGEPSE